MPPSDASFWTWLLRTDSGLLLRVAIGVAIFAVLAIVDYRRHGAAATRWREYLFLLVAASLAMIYGVVNDQITATISWEYFYYGKGVDEILGTQVPPDMAGLRWQAAKIGLKATWSAGLVAAVALLMANNPSPHRPQLPPAVLYRLLLVLLIGPVLGAIVGGVLGWLGLPAHLSTGLADLVRQDLWRPRHFLCVYGIHLGGYIGGLVAVILATLWVTKKRWTYQEPQPADC